MMNSENASLSSLRTLGGLGDLRGLGENYLLLLLYPVLNSRPRILGPALGLQSQLVG